MGRLWSLSRGSRLLLALAVGGALFGIANVVRADIPDNGVIHGCYKIYQGHALRVIDTSKGEHCLPGELPLDWNASGVTGATGPTGTTGATGPTGPAGLSLFAVVDADGTLVHGTATGAVKNVTGSYTVTFGQDVSGCSATANPGSFPGSAISTFSSALIHVASPSSDKVTVELIEDPIGLVATPFFLTLAC
jgi:hypothetical protein